MKLYFIKTLLLPTFCITLLSTTFKANAQTGKLFSADRELSSSMVNHVYQDREGVIWIATEDGLNRYDGTRFSTFRNEPGNKETLSNNNVNSVFEDSNGHLFVCTLSGLDVYNRARGVFKHVSLHGRGFYTDNANVKMVMQRRNGDLLAACCGFSGLYQISVNGDSVTADYFPIELEYGMVNLVFEDSRGTLWLSNMDRGLFCIKNGKLAAAHGLQGNIVQSLCEDKQGRLFAGCGLGGLFIMDRRDGSFKKVSHDLHSELAVYTLYATETGNVLIGTDGDGLKEYNAATNRITDVQVSTLDLNPTKMKIHSILRDRQGNMWLGAFQKGVLLLPVYSNNFKLTGWKSATQRLGSSSCVMSVLRTRSGTTLIGTDGDGLYTVSPQGATRHFAPSQSQTSVPAIITALFEDSRGTVWIGSYQHGMARLDYETGRCSYINNLHDTDGRSVQSVNSFAEDRQGRLWIGSNGNGLLCLDLATGHTADWTTMEDPQNCMYNKWINKVLIAADGKIYAGTYGGLSCLDPKKRSWTSVFGTNRLLHDETVLTLHEDARHRIWAGTSTGLICLNPRNGKTRKLTMKDGLPGNMITAILPDNNGNLWISTSHGLARLNPQTMTSVNFYADDGLQGNEFSKNAAFADSELFFGGTNGITHFVPKQIEEPKRKPLIRIAGLYLNDKTVSAGMKSGHWRITDNEVMKSDKFQLAHNDNSFSIEFTAMEFYNPMRINYSYSINGGQWITLAPGVNRISFNRLAAGTYHFKVRSCDYGIYSEPLEFTVKVHPAWYASWLAYMIYTLILAAALWYTYRQLRQRSAMKREMREHVYQEQLKEAKLQFFINISHEIRTPMQLVISPLQKLMANDKDSGRQGEYSLMMRNAQRILKLVNQLMDLRKIDKGKMRLRFRETDVNSFVADICHTFEFQMRRKNITLAVNTDGKAITAWLDTENFDKVIVNLLSNALKFTPPDGKITVSVSAFDISASGNDAAQADADNRLAKYFELSVADTGIGIEQDKMSHIFERFYQIDNSITATSTGTGVGLNLVRELVALHHGTITVKNNTPGQGCTFIVRVPLGREHINDEDIVEGAIVTTAQRADEPAAGDEEMKALPSDSAAKPKTRYKVLLAEDEEDIREYITRELSAEYHVTACADGQEAWSRLRRDTFDILISDVMMPGVDGFTLCRKVKQNIHTNTVPVILLTAKTLETDKITGLDTGADAYITKPFNLELLKTSVNNLLRNRSLLKNSFEGRQEQDVDVTALHEESPNDKLMRRVMKVINDNISDPGLNVDTISREVGISRVHLYRKLKEMTNQSARDFLRNIRLKHAAELLKQGNSNISRIAELTGFSSVSVFSHAFKELYGVSPSDYNGQNEGGAE